jgi:acyl-CoA synthetase (NDP forming)
MKNILTTIDPAYQITVGNQLDLTVTDHLEMIGKEDGIDTFFLYLEGFKRLGGERFLKTARRLIGSGKKIVAYKSGRTSEGARAVASHTAAMAGDYFIFRRLLGQAGVLLTDTLDDFEDCMRVFSILAGSSPAGNRVGIISDAGYECSSASDALGTLELARFSDSTLEGLKENLPDIVNPRNPVDSTPATTTPKYCRCAELIINDPNTDCIVISNVASTAAQENLPPGEDHSENIYKEGSHPDRLIKLVQNTEKPVVISMNGGKIYDPAVGMMEEAGLCVFRKIDRAVKALERFVKYSRE